MLGSILKSTWPLFLGVSFLMLGNGLQGTLIGWRGDHEGFTSTTMGIIMAGYFLGFMGGSKFSKSIVENVGHIRVFAALASVASAAILLQLVFIDERVWFAMRIVTGFCFAGSYVVVESWLNQRATNLTRGSLFSIYMVVTFASLTAGQWLFKLSDPSGVNLFIIASVLLSLSLIPLLISRTETPEVEHTDSIGMFKLYRISPAGVSGLILIGMAQSAMFAMGTLYAKQVGMNTTQIASFMSIMIAFGAVSQWPLGKVSDLFDRRVVMVILATLATGVCAFLYFLDPLQSKFIWIYGVLGALNLPLYAISIAHANDRLDPSQLVGASSALVFTFGLGSVIGPLTVGVVLDFAGANSYFIYLALIHLAIVVITCHHISRRGRVADEHQVQYQVVPLRGTAIVMEAIAQHTEDAMEEDNEWT